MDIKEKNPEIPARIMQRWQRIVNLLASSADVPAALIMKGHPTQIEVFVTSQTQNNPYEKGEKVDLDSGLYCEAVMGQDKPLHVADALSDPEWDHNPDIKLGMTYYYGFPLKWPDDEIFGTLCILDFKDNPRATLSKDLLFEFSQVIECELRLLIDAADQEEFVIELQNYKKNLEKKVEARTIELKDKNRELSIKIAKIEKVETKLKRLALAIDHSSDTIVITDTMANIIYVNPAFEKITGYSRKEILGINPRILNSGNHDKSFYKKLWEKISNGKTWSGRFINKKKDGSFYTEQATISPVFSDKGKIVNFVAVKRDITEQLKLESQLRQALKMESIGTLTGGIAHDFNNIMAIILGNTELALEDVQESHPLHSNLKEIESASFRASNIVKQLLSFTRLTDLQLLPIEVALVIKDALRFLRSTIPTFIDIDQDIQVTDETILADKTQINQIMMNLCINASHAMEQTGGTLTIIVENVILDDNFVKDYPDLKKGRHIKITIGDTGPGIDHKIIDRIFDPYFTTKEIGKGSGMGLAVVHGIVKNHSGVIIVDSSPAKGTRFTMFFPLAQEKAALETQTIKELSTGDETILFVDDEISIVNMVKRMFERLGYKVETATTAQDALKRFAINPHHFDLVITDMTMPRMTGVQLSESLMDIRKDIPIIICTGHSALVDEEKAGKLGLAYITKPINMLETAQTIRNILDKKKCSS
jgi:PAS domain S-box-containing protein